MPVLPIENFARETAAWVFPALIGPIIVSHMIYPDESIKRDEVLEYYRTRDLLNGAGGNTQLLDDLFKQRDHEKPYWRGHLAGQILQVILHMTTQPDKEVGYNKAVHVVSETINDDDPSPKSSRFIKGAWRTHRCVAHLWMASFVIDRMKKQGKPLNQYGLEFLSYAHAFQELGERQVMPRSARSKKYLLQPGEAWSIPEVCRLEMPKFKFDPLPPEWLEALETYRAPA